jgi:hypothetical protein
MNVVDMSGWEVGRQLPGAWENWLVFIVGGIIFAVLIGVLFEWALIILSSITGATLITQSLRLQAALLLPLFAVLVVTGILVQALLYRAERSRRPSPKAQRIESPWR